MQTNMHEAKTKLSKLVDAAISGEKVIIAKAGKPLVQLVPCKPNVERVFGALKGEIKISSDFDSLSTNDEISDLFGI